MSEAISAPIPPDLARRSSDPLGDAAFASTDVRVIRERNFAHIPSFYTPHTNPSEILVTQGGVPIAGARGKLSFTVADVAPERRWAIRESGEVMPQHVFESHLMRVREEWFEKVEKVKPPGDLQKEVIPSVQRFVTRTPDPSDPSRLIEIGFDPNAKPDPSGERRLWDAKGEESVAGGDRLRMLLDAYHSPTLRKVLKKWEIEEVEAHLSGDGGAVVSGASGLVAKLEELNAMLAAGDISREVHSRRVSLLTGATMPDALVPDAPEKPKRRMGYSAAPCGVELPNVHKRKHIASCPACQEKTASEAP